MKSQLFIALVISIIAFTATSCKRVSGCTNPNAENYNPDADKDNGSCKCRYASAVSVEVIPATDGAGDAWDPFSAPDLFVRLAKASANTWNSTNIDDEASIPSSLIFYDGEVPLTNETWQFEIVDDDSPDADDVIYSGSFNPVMKGSAGNIIISGNGVNVRFEYVTKNK